MKFNSSVSLEKELIQSIRGYTGYEKVETREKTDKRLREYLASEIKKIEKAVLRIAQRISKNGDSSISEAVNKLINRLKNLFETLNAPTYNSASFFNHSPINSETLMQLYEYESLLKHHVDILADEISEWENIEEISETDEFLNHLFDVIDNVNQILMEREFLITGENEMSMLS